MIGVGNSDPAKVFSFVRANERDAVFAVFNFSSEARQVRFSETLHHGEYRAFPGRETVSLDASFVLELPAWSHRIYVRQGGG